MDASTRGGSKKMSRCTYGLVAAGCLLGAMILGAGGPTGPTKCWVKVEQNCCTVSQGPNLTRKCGAIPCPDLLTVNEIFDNRHTSTAGFLNAVPQVNEANKKWCKWEVRYCHPVTNACTPTNDPATTVACYNFAFSGEGCQVQID